MVWVASKINFLTFLFYNFCLSRCSGELRRHDILCKLERCLRYTTVNNGWSCFQAARPTHPYGIIAERIKYILLWLVCKVSTKKYWQKSYQLHDVCCSYFAVVLCHSHVVVVQHCHRVVVVLGVIAPRRTTDLLFIIWLPRRQQRRGTWVECVVMEMGGRGYVHGLCAWLWEWEGGDTLAHLGWWCWWWAFIALCGGNFPRPCPHFPRPDNPPGV